MRVLDLGGTVSFWTAVPTRPQSVTLVNLGSEKPEPGIETVQADACTFDPGSGYDIVISNSLIEHVGGPVARTALARVIRTAAPRRWIQTPYRYFPIEPHWLFPGFQFLPLSARASITQKWSLGHIREKDRETAIEQCLMVELLSATEMRSLFPDSEIWFERIAGVPKSMVAITR